ncbi:MAG: Asp-tRNA(Asn)/Glu-tRNA(Gln) amidotransferase subunit GatC [Patescibacteria group bacterium]
MISKEEIVKLASLSRLKLSEEEIVRFQGEMGSILAYVDKLKTATSDNNDTKNEPVSPSNKNVMREDVNPHESGIYTDKLIKAAPRHDNRYIKVKKIL